LIVPAAIVRTLRLNGIADGNGERLLVIALLALIVVNLSVGSASGATSIERLLVKPGEIPGFDIGEAQLFSTAAAVKKASGMQATLVQRLRLESEGFVEGVASALRSRGEPSTVGLSSVYEFASRVGAAREMTAELKEGHELRIGRRYFRLLQFKIPHVPGARGLAFLSNGTAEANGVQSGIARVAFTEGDCLVALGLYRPRTRNVVSPVTKAALAVSSRARGSCS
jgi:hypothetical protein